MLIDYIFFLVFDKSEIRYKNIKKVFYTLMTCFINRGHTYEYRDKTEFLTVKKSRITGENYFLRYILFLLIFIQYFWNFITKIDNLRLVSSKITSILRILFIELIGLLLLFQKHRLELFYVHYSWGSILHLWYPPCGIFNVLTKWDNLSGYQ